MAWNNRGWALLNLGRNAEALTSFDKAIALDPNLTLAWINRGNTLRDLGQHPEQVGSKDTPLVDSVDSRHIPPEVKAAVWERDGGKCVICGSTQQLEYDHEIPYSRGGSNTMNNIRILCIKCNRSKHAKIE